MKEKKVGFWTYYKALNFGPVPTANRQGWAILGTILLIWGLNWIGGQSEPIFLSFTVFGVMALRCLADITRVRPSLYNLLPIGRGRKKGFFFLSVLLTTVIAVVAVVCMLLVVGLFFGLIVLAVSGEWIFVAEETEAAVSSCLQGELLALILSLGELGGAMLISCVGKKLWRHFLTVAMPIVTVVPFAVIMLFHGLETGTLFVLFDTLPYSYVYLIVFGVIAAALFAAGLIKMLQFLDGKEGRRAKKSS